MLDVLLPPRCIMTGRIVERQGAVDAEAWQRLVFIAEPLCDRCGVPFPFGVEEGAWCGACLQREPAFGRARAALVYDETSRDMILRFKHADQTHAVHSFLPWVTRAGAVLLEQADLVVPVPLHRWRLLRRRYNQAALLAQAVGRLKSVPCVPDLLMRRRATDSQGHMTAKERRRNVRSAFTVHPARKEQVAGRRILLVDDVLTTGATVEECAKALRRAGALTVDVLALARVVKSE